MGRRRAPSFASPTSGHPPKNTRPNCRFQIVANAKSDRRFTPESETDPKPATNSTHGDPPGPTSLCEKFAETIGGAVQAGLSAQRIYQDLVCEHGFQGSYCSVKCFVRRNTQRYALPFRRVECAAGDEMQIDFGDGAKTTTIGGGVRAPICSGRCSRIHARATARSCGAKTPSR